MKEQLSVDQQVVAAIFTKYIQAKIILENMNVNQSSVLKEDSVNYGNNAKQQEDIKHYEKHVQIVDTVLALLPKNEYSYIIRTFLIKSNKNWLKKHYHHEDYEKLQKAAIKRFLYLYLI